MNKKYLIINILVFGLTLVLATSCSNKISKFKDIIRQKDFLNLNATIANSDSLKNIAVLPEKTFVVINGTVINMQKQTYGPEPELGFYIEYYSQGSKYKYNNFNQLLDSIQVKLDSTQVLTIIDKMKELGIQDIIRDKKDTLLINYRWDVSAMYGEGGVIFTSRNITKTSTKLNVFEKLDKDFYYFEN